MTLLGTLRHLGILAFGNDRQRRSTLHLLKMKRRGIDLSGVSVEDLGLPSGRSERYGNSGGPDLDTVLQTVPIAPDDAVLDLGCGKGGAMITLAQHPFARVDGVEISHRLARIARLHLARAGVRNAAVIACDAAEFKDYDRYTMLYMYNPFTEVVLTRVIDHLRASLRRCPRPLRLVYYNPVCHDLLVRNGFRPQRDFDHAPLLFRLYENP